MIIIITKKKSLAHVRHQIQSVGLFLSRPVQRSNDVHYDIYRVSIRGPAANSI